MVQGQAGCCIRILSFMHITKYAQTRVRSSSQVHALTPQNFLPANWTPGQSSAASPTQCCMATRNNNHLHGQNQLHGDTKDMLDIQLIACLDTDDAVMTDSKTESNRCC